MGNNRAIFLKNASPQDIEKLRAQILALELQPQVAVLRNPDPAQWKVRFEKRRKTKGVK